MDNQKITIQAHLRHIVFSSDNGFLIGKFDLDRAAITCTGTIINPQVGVEYKMLGKWVVNPKFGKQFQIERHSTLLPRDPQGIFKYLVRICKYVGPAIGNLLVDKYGAETLNILKESPEEIAKEIKGLTLEKALLIQDSLIANEVNEQTQIELETMLNVPGIKKSLISELMVSHGGNAPERVRENPYSLTEFSGIGFILADKVAMNIGMKPDHINRKKAVTLYCMAEARKAGNVWTYEAEVITRIKILIQVPNLREGIDVLLKEGVIVKNNGALTTKELMLAERNIAKFVLLGGQWIS